MKLRSISLSQLGKYSACGKQWQLGKIIRAPRVQSMSQVFGTAVHAGLETFNNDHYIAKSVPVDRAAIIAEFKHELSAVTEQALLEEHTKIKGQKNSRVALRKLDFPEFKVFVMDELTQVGISLLDQYITRTDHGTEALSIEDRRTEDLYGLTFRYIIDLLDVYQGKVRLRDYKTKNRADPKLARLQLTGYAWALREYQDIQVEIVEQLNFVRTASNPRLEILHYDMADLQADFVIFEREVDTFIRGVRSDIFPRNHAHYCDSCEVKEVCFDPVREAEITDAADEEEDNNELELGHAAPGFTGP